MNVVIPKESLTHLLYLTNTIVERRNTMPILANVKLKAENNSLQVSATDLEVSLIGQTDAEVSTAGSVTVNARFLYDIVRELPADSVTLKVDKGERLDVEAGQSRFKINGISSEEFPSIMGVTLNNPTTVEAAKLYEMLEKTSYAVSMDETRYNINGVFAELVESENGAGEVLRFVATDGHRLAMIDRPAESFDIGSGVIIPRKGIQELKKVIENNEGTARVAVGNGFFTVQSENVTLGIRLIDGDFPDYRQVLPKETKTTASVDKNDFLSMVKRVSLVTTDKSRSVRFKVYDGNLVISSSSPEYGEASESLKVEQTGEDVSIGFSAKYVIDLISTMTKSETITINFMGELGPGEFVGDAEDNYRCIVMPMRFD